MKKTYLLLFILLPLLAFAQENALGKVTVAELESKKYEKDTSAPAAILFSKCNVQVHFGDNISSAKRTIEVQQKIKIYDKAGYEYANKSIPYIGHKREGEKVEVKSAITYNLVNGEIVKTPLAPEGTFDEEPVKGLKVKKLILPNVKEGSIVEMRYVITSPLFFMIPDWDFQEDIPVYHTEMNVQIPSYFTFNNTFRGYHKGSITHSVLPYVGNADIITHYVLDTVPALKDVSFVNNIDNYKISVEHELKAISLPGISYKMFASSWESVVNKIYRREDFLDELNKDGYFKEDINAVISSSASEEEKMKAVFSFIQNRMAWTGQRGAVCAKGVKAAYKEKSGNVGDINLMLVAALRYAGIIANPVLVCSRENKIPFYPTYKAFDYVVCSASVNGKVYLLDATSKWSTPDVLPERAINWQGYQVALNGGIDVVPLIPVNPSSETMMVTATLDAEGTIAGKLRKYYTGHEAMLFRELYSDIAGKEKYIEVLEKMYKRISISDYKVKNLKDAPQQLLEEFDFTSKEGAEIIGDRMYITPLLFFTQDKNPFIAEKRDYPIDFGHPSQQKFMFTIALPQGYIVESVPAAVGYSMENNAGNYKYSIQQLGNSIQLSITTSINQAIVEAEYYQFLKDLFQLIITKQNEKIVLKKA
ncbi:DUF3857 domain-containing protein [Flavobacterium sp. RHBU_3]|uniref:DUF3857 domain-containing protein n=1 Tax=Flavobacterium sp. RHBU_3 TaxID=3391184 RepID=UPI003984B80C